jgi:hypothetical protein
MDHAVECVRLADLTGDDEVRNQLLGQASQWMADAAHERYSDQPGKRKRLKGRARRRRR